MASLTNLAAAMTAFSGSSKPYNSYFSTDFHETFQQAAHLNKVSVYCYN